MAIIGGSTPTYQSFTDEMQDAAFNLGVGLFGIPLGTTFLSEISNYMTQTQGATVDTLYDVVMNSSVGTSASFYPTYLTDSQFAERLANNLIGTSGTLVSADAWTAGKDWAVTALQGGMSRAALAKLAVDTVAGIDTADATYGPAAAAFDNKVTVANYYTFDKAGASSDITTLQNVISSVTDDAATVTSAQSAIDDSAVEASAKTVMLTTSADIVGTGASIASALQVSNNNDTIIAFVGRSASTATTLSNADSIDGGAGTDTLRITAENSAAANRVSPVGSSIEVVEVFAVSNSAANLGFTNLAGVTALNLKGTSDANINGLAGGINVTLSDGYTKTATLALKTDTTADSITLNVGGGNSAGLRDGAANSATGIEVVNLVATAAFANDSVFDFQAASALNISGTANVTLNFQVGTGNFGVTATGLASGADVNRLSNINASALGGSLTMYISTAGVDQTIVGGAGDDTFFASGGFNQSDSLDAGAGTDSLKIIQANSGTNRPVIQGVETLTVDFNADATIDLRNSSAASIATLNVFVDSTATTAGNIFSGLSSATKTVNIYTGASANALTLGYGSGAASDLTVTLTNQTSSTASASYNVGDLFITNNSGTLTINAAGTATAQGFDDFSANAVGLTINADNNLLGVGAMSAAAAKTVTLNVNGGKQFSADASAVFPVATAVTINVSGASALVNFADEVRFGSNANVTITLGTGVTGLTIGQSASTGLMFQSFTASANSTTATMDASLTVNNAGDGDVTLSGLSINPDGTAAASAFAQLNFGLTVTQTGTGAVFNATSMDFGEFASGAVTFTLNGAGTFNLLHTAAMTATTGQVQILASGMSTGSFLSANFSAVTDANVTFDVTLGAGSAMIALGAGADRVYFGLGAATVRGGAGNDDITMSNTAVSVLQYNNTATAAAANQDGGVDTIFGAGSGDIILFAGYATGTTLFTAGITTGTATTAGQVRSATLTGTTTATYGSAAGGDLIAMYTAAGDLVIEVMLISGGMSGVTVQSGEVSKFVLNGKGDVEPTALLRIDTNASGLLITML